MYTMQPDHIKPIPAWRKNVNATLNYASFWKRLGARLLDQLVLIVPGALIFLVVDLVFQDSLRYALRNNPLEVVTIDATKRLWKSGLATLITWLYFALFECSVYQGPPGKWLLRLTVTDKDGNRLTFGRATGRYFAKLISGLTLGIGFLMALFTEKRQMLHDIIANCLVLDNSTPRGSSSNVRNACPSCGQVSVESARFCAGCGNPLVVKCEACGQEAPIHSGFCSSCGARVASVEYVPAASRWQSFDRNQRRLFVILGICGIAALMVLGAYAWNIKEARYVNDKEIEYALIASADARTSWTRAVVAPQLKRWERAAEAGNAFANYVLGRTYYWGAGLEQSYSMAFKYMRVAAEYGIADAQNHLGAMYVKGEGVSENGEEAVYWFKKAAQQGNATALHNLVAAEKACFGHQRH